MSLALSLTLLDLLLRPIGSGWLRPALLVFAAAGLVLPRARRAPLFWLALAGLAAWRVIEGWPLADNHAYLLAYWLLAAGLALLSREPGLVLAWNARALIGLAFAFAVVWKLLSPDYLDGRFFRVTLVEDRRLEPFTRWAGGLDDEALRERRSSFGQHVDAPGLTGPAPPEPARLRTLALAATWSALALEAAVAVAFLAPLGRCVWLRHALLLLFCATTYAIAPVASFGWLLLAMGVAQCGPDARRTRLAYLGVFAMLVFYSDAPWLRSGTSGVAPSAW
jgi:hypothetical protein